jgi:hypothetical protein
LVQKLFDLQWFRDLVGSSRRRFDLVVFQDGIADSDALIANIGPWVVAGGGNQFSDYVLAFMAKRTS